MNTPLLDEFGNELRDENGQVQLVPMKKFKVTTRSTCITEYIVEALDQETAEEFYADGAYVAEQEVDYQNEEVLTIEEL